MSNIKWRPPPPGGPATRPPVKVTFEGVPMSSQLARELYKTFQGQINRFYLGQSRNAEVGLAEFYGSHTRDGPLVMRYANIQGQEIVRIQVAADVIEHHMKALPEDYWDWALVDFVVDVTPDYITNAHFGAFTRGQEDTYYDWSFAVEGQPEQERVRFPDGYEGSLGSETRPSPVRVSLRIDLRPYRGLPVVEFDIYGALVTTGTTVREPVGNINSYFDGIFDTPREQGWWYNEGQIYLGEYVTYIWNGAYITPLNSPYIYYDNNDPRVTPVKPMDLWPFECLGMGMQEVPGSTGTGGVLYKDQPAPLPTTSCLARPGPVTTQDGQRFQAYSYSTDPVSGLMVGDLKLHTSIANYSRRDVPGTSWWVSLDMHTRVAPIELYDLYGDVLNPNNADTTFDVEGTLQKGWPSWGFSEQSYTADDRTIYKRRWDWTDRYPERVALGTIRKGVGISSLGKGEDMQEDAPKLGTLVCDLKHGVLVFNT